MVRSGRADSLSRDAAPFEIRFEIYYGVCRAIRRRQRKPGNGFS
jgi:hypothetical protein